MDVSHILPILLLLFTCSNCDKNVNMTIRQTITGSKDWDGALKAFRETVIRVFVQQPYLKTLMLGHPIGVATVWLLYVIKMVKPKGLSTWAQIGDKVDLRVSKGISDNNLEDLRSVVNVITYRMGKAKFTPSKFTKQDLSIIRATGPKFFPQSYTSGVYTGKWCTVLLKYLTILNAGYIDLMKAKKYDECAWADVLTRLRPKILMAVKKLAKSRYQDIGKVAWKGGTLFDPEAKLTLTDGATGTLYSNMPLKTIFSRFTWVLHEDLKSYLMENLVDKFNLLYNDAWIGVNCNVPAKITEKEVSDHVNFPYSCRDDNNDKCELPCGGYGENYKWCITTVLGGNYWRTPDQHGIAGKNQWAYCDMPNWETCMPTLDTSLIEWQDEDYDKKMKINR